MAPEINYVTGAKGFIGSHIVARLENVVAIPHADIPTIRLQPYKGFYFFSGYGWGNMKPEDDNPTIQANVIDLISMVTQRRDFKAFVYASTSIVDLPLTNMYLRTKKAGEEILSGFDLPITIVRPFTVTGVGEQEYKLISVLLKASINNTRVNLSEGVHDFMDIDDFVDGVLHFAGQRGIFELGTGIGTTNQQVVEIVERVTGKKLDINCVPQMRAYDNPDWYCKNVAWKPKKTLEVSVAEMYESIRKNN